MAAALPEGNLQRQLPNLVRHSLVRGDAPINFAADADPG
jgi:hypothetical protein